MGERRSGTPRTLAARVTALRRRMPVGILLLLVPSWATYLLIDERDTYEPDQWAFYYIPDLVEDPLRIPPALILTPFVNTEGDQILLVTGLFLVFGIFVERGLGTWFTLGLFWGATVAGALGGGVILHMIHPFLGHIEPIDDAMQRVFNGGSAAGFGYFGAFAASSRRWWPWVVVFLAWEVGFWSTVSQDFTSVFHLLAYATGFASARYFSARGQRVGGGVRSPLHER